MSKEIQLTQDKVAIVDDADFEWLNQYKWYANKYRNTFYAVRRVYLGGGRKHERSKMILMHREILKPPDGIDTDHKDGNGLNNQSGNLRNATKAQNAQNRRAHSRGTSKYKGVSWHRDTNKWLSCIRAKTRYIHLGLFVSEKEAAKAYDKAAKKYFGEFARTNF
jgi:hypothetical protein